MYLILFASSKWRSRFEKEGIKRQVLVRSYEANCRTAVQYALVVLSMQ
jgi:hypothetical protein